MYHAYFLPSIFKYLNAFFDKIDFSKNGWFSLNGSRLLVSILNYSTTKFCKIQYLPEVTLQSLASPQIQIMTRHDVQLIYIMCEGTWVLEQPPKEARLSWLQVVS